MNMIISDNPENTYISRAEIVELTGVSAAKVAKITDSKHLDFPKIKMTRGFRHGFLYDRQEVLKWLKTNDIKNLVPSQTHSSLTSNIDNKLVKIFLLNKSYEVKK